MNLTSAPTPPPPRPDGGIPRGFGPRLARMLFGLFGWRAVGRVPDEPRFIALGAPHTTNWDLALALFASAIWKMKMRWVGKDTLFKPPFGFVLRWLGGVPVVRGSRSGAVESLATLMHSEETFALCIAPEGTRGKVDHWKSGFYQVALAAKVPVVLGYVDYPNKTLGLGPAIHLTGDVEADMKRIADFYADKRGKFPENEGDIRLQLK
jgi:1-acyl-sn-glycerol-3-phosphate acyltransferase